MESITQARPTAAPASARSTGPQAKPTAPSAAPAIAPATPDVAPPSAQERKAAELERLSDPVLAKFNQRLSIAFDDKTDRFVYRIYDRSTGELVRQLPPESVFELMGQLREAVGAAVPGTGNSLDRRL